MTLKSLDKLRKRGMFNLAQTIEDEVENYYLPRPLFEDDEPVQFGDQALVNGETGAVESIDFWPDGSFFVGTKDNDGIWRTQCYGFREESNRVKRPPETDTQKLIDDDAMLPPDQYCKKYDLPPQAHDMYSLDREKSKHLLERQRKLLGCRER